MSQPGWMSSRTNTKIGVGACNLQQNCSTTDAHQFKLMELHVKSSEFLLFCFYLLSLQIRMRGLLWKRSKLPGFQVKHVKVLTPAIMKHHQSIQRVYLAVYKPAQTKTPEQLYLTARDTKKKPKTEQGK